MSFIVSFVAAWSLLWAAAGGVKPATGSVKPAPLSVSRCCPPGQALTGDALRVAVLTPGAVATVCGPIAEPVTWTPRIYAPARGRYLDPGFLPSHWRIIQGKLPSCEPLRVLPEHAAPYALHANDGFMLLRGASRPLPPDRYCADVAAALVCAEDAALAPAKCCAEGHAFNGTRCVVDADRAQEAMGELRVLANGSSVGLGWPACAEGSRYAVAGALAGARLAAGGALELRAAGGGGGRLAAGAWCAEAVLGQAGARVLACEAAARAGRGGQATRHALYGAGLAVGAAFLAATLVAGFALPAAHHALHWRCQTHYVAALMLGDVLLAATQLAGDVVPPTLCRALGEPRRWCCVCVLHSNLWCAP